MKILTFYLAMLGFTLAVPNGYYHQEYNYKTSSSSFKNNELQHKTDDQGYYRKDGDLEGHVKPIVDANNEHSEYVNPNAQGAYGYSGGANTDFSSTGNMRAQSRYTGYGSNSLDAEGYAQSDRIIGSGGYSSGYSSSYGSNNIGSNSQSSGTSSNLRLITSRLQQELESELQEAIRQNHIYPQSRVGISQLERELRRNLTERLNNELNARYGQQMVRGGMSYTITGGRLQSTANYDNEELGNLRRQLENSLMNQLRTQYSSSNSQYYNRQSSYGGYTTVRPVYSSVYPSLPTYTTTVRYPVDYNHANYQTIRYTPITNPQSITNIASNIQSRLDSRLNEVLDETRRKYFSTNSQYSLTNTDVLLERIRNELRSNLTYLLDEDIRRNYGTQIQRDGYFYSVGPSGQTSTDYNYSLRDLENLKQQVERNLIEKLNRDFETHRSSWSSHQSYNSQSSFGSNYQYSSTPHYEYISSPRYDYTTPRYEVFTTPRQSYINHYPTSASQHGDYIQTGGSGSNQYEYASGSQQSGYGMQSSGSIAQLQRQLQDDLSRQLRGALRTGHYSSYSSGGISSPQNYQTTLQQLTNELNRNLTRHLQEYSAMGSYAAYGNFDNAQMQRLKAQLQDSLINQLQQGLQQSYQSSSSYSSSSSSSSSGNANYRPVRGFQNYHSGQYRSGIETMPGEDCLGDDPNAYSYLRSKRSFSSMNSDRNYHHQPNNYEFIQQTEDNGNGKTSTYEQGQNEMRQDDHENFQFSQQGRDQIEVGQQTDDNELETSHPGQVFYDSDLTEVGNTGYEKLQFSNYGKQVDNLDLTQQVEDSGYGKLQVLNQGQQDEDIDLTQQQVDNSDLTQQLEDSGYEQLQVSNHGQQVDDSDLTQHVEDSGYEKLQISNQGQEIDDIDITQQVDSQLLNQQVEESSYGKLQVSNQGQKNDDIEITQQQVDNKDLTQQVDNKDLTQQVEDSSYGKLQISNQGQQVDNIEITQQVEESSNGKLQISNHGQHVDDSDLTQQVQGFGYGKFQISNQGKQLDDTHITQQQIDNAYFTQQVEESSFGKLQVSNQGQRVDGIDLTQQQVDSADLTHVEDFGHEKLHVSNQGQQVDDIDITPQIEDSSYGNLQFGNHGQQVDNADLTQQVEDSGYGKLQVSNLGQQVDNIESTQQTSNAELTQPIEYSGYGNLAVSNHSQLVDDSDLKIQQVEDSGKLQVLNQGQQVDDIGITQQQVDNADLTQQVEYSDYGKLQVLNHGQHVDDSDLTEQTGNSGNEDLQGQQIDDIDIIQKLENANLTQQVEDSNYDRNLQFSNHGQQVDDSDLFQQVPDSGYGKLKVSNQDQRVYDTDISQQVDNADSTQQVESSGYRKLQVSTHSQMLDDLDLTQQVEDSSYGKLQVPIHGQQVHQSDLTQHDVENAYGNLQIPGRAHQEDYLLENQQIENSGFRQFQVPSQISHVPSQSLQIGIDHDPTLEQVVVSSERGSDDIQTESEIWDLPWCSKYIDTSLMDAPWQLSRQLKDEIVKQYHQLDNGITKPQKEILYKKILGELPKNIMYSCFHVHDMKLNKQEEDEQVERLDSYFRYLIKKEINNIIQGVNDNNVQKLTNIILQKSKKVEATSEENLENQHIQGQATSQVIESNGINNELNVPQNITPGFSSDSEDPKKSEGVTFVITDQGQFYQRPQTKLEAEHIADSLINSIRKSQRNQQNQQRVEENYTYYRSHDHGSYGSQNHVHENYRPYGQSYGSRYSHNGKYNNPGSSVIQEDPSYKQHRSYEYQDQYQSYNKHSDHDVKPLKYEHENLESISHGAYRYQSPNPLGYHQHPLYSTPLNYGRTEVIEQNFETVSDLKPEKTYHVIVDKPVYSGVKGRSKFRSHSYQPNSPQIQPQSISPLIQSQPVSPQLFSQGKPSTVVEEPVAKQNIVDSVDDSQVVHEEIVPAQDTASTTEENLPWWKRFGNKVKQGASDLKKKIIG